MDKEMNSEVPVLIVGAGPTGLMMGCELARHGISFRIIDKNSEPTPSSNATWIQTLTIEMFDHIGIAEKFIKASNLCEAVNIYISGKSIGKIPLNYIESLHKYILMLPQNKTEKMLIQLLEEQGKNIERSSELIDVKQNKNSVKSTIKHDNGATEIITSNYVVACDGANSIVREKCKMLFSGKDLTEQFVVADATIDSYMSKDEVHIFFNEGEIFAAFPLGEDRYRISANLNLPVTRNFFYEKQIIEMAQERAHGAYYVKNVSWISLFWIHGKIIKKMRNNLIFFAGDAAHLHSPAGGQGMNTGLQDAYNLAWKLAIVIKTKAKPSILNSYHTERHPIVSNIVKKTNQYTQMAIDDKLFLKKLRQFMTKFHKGKEKEKISKKIGMDLTQINIEYKKSPIIKYGTLNSKVLRSGQHAPNVLIDEEKKLYEHLHKTQHNVLLFTGNIISKNKLNEIVKLKEDIDQNYSDLIKTQIIATKELNTVKVILDKNENIHKRYGVKKPTIFILRPDNYIAYYSIKLDFSGIKKFLNKYLLIKNE